MDDLSIYYAHQYVANEESSSPNCGTELCYWLQHTPILPGSIIGAVFVGDTRASDITAPSGGGIAFVDRDITEGRVLTGKMDYIKGWLHLTWDRKVKNTKVVVSYEYDSEPNPNP